MSQNVSRRLSALALEKVRSSQGLKPIDREPQVAAPKQRPPDDRRDEGDLRCRTLLQQSQRLTTQLGHLDGRKRRIPAPESDPQDGQEFKAIAAGRAQRPSIQISHRSVSKTDSIQDPIKQEAHGARQCRVKSKGDKREIWRRRWRLSSRAGDAE